MVSIALTAAEEVHLFDTIAQSQAAFARLEAGGLSRPERWAAREVAAAGYLARQKLIQAYLPLVYSASQQLRAPGPAYDDLVQAGVSALIQAVTTFAADPRQFRLYVIAAVAKAVQTAAAQQDAWQASLPHYRATLRALQAELQQQDAPFATLAAIQDLLDLSPDQLIRWIPMLPTIIQSLRNEAGGADPNATPDSGPLPIVA